MYCSHCGVQVQPEQKFCPACGQPLGPGPVALGARKRVETHLQLLAILWLAYAGLKVLAAVAAIFAGNVILTRMQFPLELHFVPHLVSSIGWGLLVVSAVGVLAGGGLLSKAPWARLLALVLAFFALFNIPFGTALGIYTLWVLLPEESARAYDRLAATP